MNNQATWVFSCVPLSVMAGVFLVLASLSAYSQSNYAAPEPGQFVERELKGGESHTYSLNLNAGQFLHMVAEQVGIDVVLRLFDPDGKQLAEMDRDWGQIGDEPLWYVSELAGVYRLEVISLKKGSPGGKYSLKTVELRPSISRDRTLVAFGKASMDAWDRSHYNSEEKVANSINDCKAAAEVFRQLGDKDNQAYALRIAARFYEYSFKSELALEHYKQSLELYESLDKKSDIAGTLDGIGRIYKYNLDYLKAIEYYQRALVLADSAGDIRDSAVSRNNLGIIQMYLGDFVEATKNYETVLRLARSINSDEVAVLALNNLGSLYSTTGNYALALEFLERGLSISSKLGDGDSVAHAWLNLGILRRRQGYIDLALENLNKALNGFRKLNDAKGITVALDQIGGCYDAREESAKALEYLKQAFEIEQEKGIRNNVSIGNIGMSYFHQGDRNNAVLYLQKAVDLANGNDAWALSKIAISHMVSGNYQQSLDFSDRAKRIARKMGSQEELESALVAEGKTYIKLQRFKEARQDLSEAISIAEDRRKKVVGGLLSQVDSTDEFPPLYRVMVELTGAENKPTEALTYAEAGKAQTLLNVLHNGNLNITKAMTAPELESDRQLRIELAALNIRISNMEDDTKLADLSKQLERKRIEFNDFQDRMYSTHPELKIQRGDLKTVSAEESGELLSDANSAIVEFVVADEKAFVFVITKDAANRVSLKLFTVEVKDVELEKRVEAFGSKLASGGLDFQKQSRALYDLLLRPAAAHLAGKTSIIIVPDGPLWNLPFQTLRNEQGKYLIEQAAVSYAPSLTALREMSKKAKVRKPDAGLELVAFGNPTVAKSTSDRLKRVFMSERLDPLPESERLVNELGKMYGANRSRVYVGSQAREETAKSESPKYRVVQFATHGILNNVSPMYSHLVMAQKDKNPNEDGLLEAWEMKDLDLKADMVILSACDTARGRISNGEGVIGMSWAMFIAGAPTTVASQWKVESRSTTELMLEFHRQLLTKPRISKAEALRRASLKLIKTPKYRHPSYWAPWILVGDGS